MHLIPNIRKLCLLGNAALFGKIIRAVFPSVITWCVSVEVS